jgi:N-acetylglucosamine-6-phosphate deacetylase
MMTKKNMITRYYNGRVIRDHQIQTTDLWIENGTIIPPALKADREIDVNQSLIAPGYIDIQMNGGFGYDFSSQPEKVERVAHFLPKYGVTAFLPTIISSTSLGYQNALPYLQPKAIEGAATILGAHLEGPFFCKTKHGAHNIDFIQSSHEIPLENLYGNLEGVRIITLAPELPYSLQAIKKLKSLGIVVAAGHTSASYSTMQKGIDAGITLATHLFNAMEPLHHREPGVIGMALTHRHFYFSMIADGVHLHPAVLNLAWKANPKGLILVTDAIEALGLKNGRYRLGSKEIVVSEGKAVIANTHTLAGSVMSLDAAVRYFYTHTECSVVEAIEAATLKPAQVLGITHKGTLDIGSDADFILLSDELNIKACYIAGKLVYSASKME